MNDDDVIDVAAMASRLAGVRERIERARARAGADAVTLLAVSKRHPASAVAAARSLGLVDLGENYAQELDAKRRALADDRGIRWHMIGPVQRNKAKLVATCTMVHTVDRIELLDALEHHAAAAARTLDVLVQVNIAGEASKSGVAPTAVEPLLDHAAGCGALRVRGLMTIPPAGEPEQARPHFRALRQLRDRLATTARPRVELRELSMGMSDDLEVAIDEGATLVRVGTAIFGPR